MNSTSMHYQDIVGHLKRNNLDVAPHSVTVVPRSVRVGRGEELNATISDATGRSVELSQAETLFFVMALETSYDKRQAPMLLPGLNFIDCSMDCIRFSYDEFWKTLDDALATSRPRSGRSTLQGGGFAFCIDGTCEDFDA